MKKVFKISAYVLVVLLLGSSVAYNLKSIYSDYKTSIQQAAVQQAVQEMTQVVDKTGEFPFKLVDEQKKEHKYVIIKKEDITTSKK